jgi:hypothetical protein
MAGTAISQNSSFHTGTYAVFPLLTKLSKRGGKGAVWIVRPPLAEPFSDPHGKPTQPPQRLTGCHNDTHHLRWDWSPGVAYLVLKLTTLWLQHPSSNPPVLPAELRPHHCLRSGAGRYYRTQWVTLYYTL